VTDSSPQGLTGGDNRPLVIGLTGGIGSGKSTVADSFADLGITVVDADRLARELVAPGQPALTELVELLGPAILTTAGTLDRACLRRHIFSDPVYKHKVEEILHPRIRQRMQASLSGAPSPYCIAVIPLLVETGQSDMVDRVLVVDSPATAQHTRVAERDGLSDNVIDDIMAAQAGRETRLAAADDIITNDHDLGTLRDRVRKLHERYLEIAHADRAC
jgi:dephospho-CoA kinase